MITAERYHDISVGHRVHGHESKCAHLHGHNYRIHFTVASAPPASEILKFGQALVDNIADAIEVHPDQLIPGLDDVGRVLDFSVIKSKLCMWIEENWDHKFLAWEEDEFMHMIHAAASATRSKICTQEAFDMLTGSIVWTPFNPTAENMGLYLLHIEGPKQLAGTGCQLIKVVVEETRKCSATASL